MIVKLFPLFEPVLNTWMNLFDKAKSISCENKLVIKIQKNVAIADLWCIMVKSALIILLKASLEYLRSPLLATAKLSHWIGSSQGLDT